MLAERFKSARLRRARADGQLSRAARRSEMEGVYLAVLVLAFVGLGVACLYVAYRLLVR
jgi:hypothetical protein